MKKYTLGIMGVLFMLFSSISNVNGYGCSEYGIMAKSNFDGTCSCMSGYHFQKNLFGDTKCEKMPSCFEKHGIGSKENFDGTCSCRDGYIVGKNILGDLICEVEPSCSDIYGVGAKDDFSGNTCSCRFGYMWGKDMFGEKKCVLGISECNTKYGNNSSFNNNEKICECDEGYIFKNGMCEEKSYSYYYFLKEYSDNEAIVISYVTEQHYHLELGYSIGLINADTFIGESIVLNVGTNNRLDIYDKFVLNNTNRDDGTVADILGVSEVEESFTLKTCEELFGDNVKETYDDKCTCVEGFLWNDTQSSCTKQSTTISYTVSNSNSLNDYQGDNRKLDSEVTESNVGTDNNIIKNKIISKLQDIEKINPGKLKNLLPAFKKMYTEKKYSNYKNYLKVIIEYLE